MPRSEDERLGNLRHRAINRPRRFRRGVRALRHLQHLRLDSARCESGLHFLCAAGKCFRHESEGSGDITAVAHKAVPNPVLYCTILISFVASGLLTRPSRFAYSRQGAMKIIDTHQHLWDMDLFPYSWCHAFPALNRSFRMADYLEAARGLGVEKTVYVDADVDEPYILAETRTVLSLADRTDNPLEGVVASSRPEHEDFRHYLDQIAGHPKLKGVRRVLHTQPDELSQSGTFIENIRSLSEYGLSFDVCVLARQLPIALDLVRRCPDVRFVLDHCGNPLVKEKLLEPWRRYIREIAGCPNVVCKVSGLVANADPQNWTPEDLRPFLEPVLECFGRDRVVFGSDWPVCTLAASYARWVGALSALTRSESEENRSKLFHENAVRVYRLN